MLEVKELSPLDGPIRRGFNPLRKSHRWLLFPGKNSPDPGIGVASDLGLDLSNGSVEPASKVAHEPSMYSTNIQCKGRHYSFLKHSADPEDMDRWPQRENFKAKVKEVGEALNLTHQEIADTLGIGIDYLRSLLYRKNTRPEWDLAVKMSQVWHCDITEFIDNPGGEPPPGIDEKDFREGSPEDRVYLRAMGSDLSKLTPEQKRNAIDAWRAVVRGITGK